MKTNMGMADKAVRVLAAITILALYYANLLSGTLAIVLLIFAVIFVLTSFVGVCPLYSFFGLSTKKAGVSQSQRNASKN